MSEGSRRATAYVQQYAIMCSSAKLAQVFKEQNRIAYLEESMEEIERQVEAKTGRIEVAATANRSMLAAGGRWNRGGRKLPRFESRASARRPCRAKPRTRPLVPVATQQQLRFQDCNARPLQWKKSFGGPWRTKQTNLPNPLPRFRSRFPSLTRASPKTTQSARSTTRG